MEVETPTASPFASSLLFDYVATYMYESDTPNAERRAAALALDRDLLRELLGQEELRDLIDPGALESVEADLQRMSERTRADSPDALHDVLRRLGDLTEDELRLRVAPGADARRLARRAARGAARDPRPARRRAALGRGRGRRALPRRAGRGPAGRPPGDLPRRRARRDGAAGAALGADARPVRGARAARPLRARPHAGPRRAGTRGRAGPGRAAARRHAARVVRPGGAAAAAAGVGRRAAGRDRARRPARARRASCRAGRASTAIRRAAPGSTGCASCSCRSRASRCRRTCGSATCSRAAAAPTARAGSTSSAPPGEVVWVGAGPLGRRSGKVALYFREDAAVLGPAGRANIRGEFEERGHDRDPHPAGAGRVLLHRPAGRRRRHPERGAAGGAVGSGLGGRGDQRRVRAAALPAQHERAVRAAAPRRPGAPAPLRHPARGRPAADPGPLVAHRAAVRRRRHATPPAAAARRPSCCSSATGSSRASTCSPRGSRAGSPRSTTRWARSRRSASCQRGYFVEGLGGAQFALPGAAERLRAQRDDDAAPPIVLAATDPAQPYGGVLKWPKRESRSPARQAGAYVVLAGAEPVLYVERGGKGIQVLTDDGDERAPPALARAGRRGRARPHPPSGAREGQRGARGRARRGRSGCSNSGSEPGRASSPSAPSSCLAALLTAWRCSPPTPATRSPATSHWPAHGQRRARPSGARRRASRPPSAGPDCGSPPTASPCPAAAARAT